MNKVQTKIMQRYENLLKTQNCEGKVLGFSLLVRDCNADEVRDDSVFIVPQGKKYLTGINQVSGISELLCLCSPIDFLPEEFNTKQIYLAELSKYKITQEDEDFYFPRTQFDFSVLDVYDVCAIPALNGDEDIIIGRSDTSAGGVKYYGECGEVGEYYKNMRNVKARSGICYIAEVCFEHDVKEGEDFVFLTPDNTETLINKGGVETYESALRSVRSLVDSLFPAFAIIENYELVKKFCHKITDCIFKDADGLCFGTYLNEMDLDEELKIFLEDEFVALAMAHLHVDPEHENDFREKLFEKLGDECYMNEDFSLTNWTNVIAEF